jgi:adenosylhomocysteine nucleosidase
MWLRWAVSNWLRSEAARRAQEAVGEAMHTRAEQESSDEPPAELPPCDVGVVFALNLEAGGLLDLMQDVVVTRGAGFVARRGLLDGRRVVVIESGPGRENARQATEALIAGHRPQWIISAGLAGGVDPALEKNHLLIADNVATEAGERLAIDIKMQPAPGLHVGRLLTVDHVVRTPQERRELREQHDALAVDMESYAVAEVCREAKTRFLCVRVVSDTAEQKLPLDIEHLLNQPTRAGQAGAALGSIFRRPGSIKDMWRLREDALVAGDHLAKFLRGMIGQLAPAQEETP